MTTMEHKCRTCLKTPTEPLSIYSDNTLIYKLETIAPIQLNEMDDLPTTICRECILDINKFYDFREVIINSDKQLKQHHKTVVKVESEQLPENLILVEEKICIDEIKLESGNCSEQLKTEQDNPISSRNIMNRLRKQAKISKAVGMNKSERACTKSMQLKIIKKLLNFDGVKVEKSEEISRENLLLSESNMNESSIVELEKIEQVFTLHQCEMCVKKFESRRRLADHKRKVHGRKVPMKITICTICNLMLRADNLSRHLAIHSAKPVKCDECGKTYKNFESLRGHQLSHRGDSFTCEHCGRSYNAKNKYKTHLKSHTDPESLISICNICDKKVRNMKKHMRSHTGEKPYICTYCNKGLSSNMSLRRHLKIHTDVKRFKCDQCTLYFSLRASLKNHLRIKHNIKL